MSFIPKFDRPKSIDAGTYRAWLLTVNDCDIQYLDNPVRPGLEFRYVIDLEGKEHHITRKVAKTINERSNLYKDLKGMLGSQLTKEMLDDDAKLGAVIESMVGKPFIVVLTVNDKGFNKIESVVGEPAQSPKRAPAQHNGTNAKPVRPKPDAPSESNDIKTGFENYPDHPGATQGAPPPIDDDDLPF